MLSTRRLIAIGRRLLQGDCRLKPLCGVVVEKTNGATCKTRQVWHKRRLKLRHHVDRERLRLFLLEDRFQPAGQQLVRLHEVHTPDDAVPIVFLRVLRHEVKRHEWRIGPVDEPCRQAVMLAERQPVPDRLDPVCRLPVRVFGEVAQQRLFQRVDARLPSGQAHQAVRQFVRRRGQASEGVRGAEPLQRRVPRLGKQHLIQFAPRFRLVHSSRLSRPSALLASLPPVLTTHSAPDTDDKPLRQDSHQRCDRRIDAAGNDDRFASHHRVVSLPGNIG